MREPTFTCPYCGSPPWRSRYLFWRHLNGCVKKLEHFRKAYANMKAKST